MFSYRHVFHAGNHADVLKHMILLECIELLQQKAGGLMFLDSHAGAGLYDLSTGYATVSDESVEGIFKLLKHEVSSLPPTIKNYLDRIHSWNNDPKQISVYPGSPSLLLESLRPQDKLRLFELHPTDFSILNDEIKSLNTTKLDIQVLMQDGFSGLKAFLPPPSRRGLILMDPSYEDKSDYFKVLTALEEGLKRFATGVYIIWYPCLSRNDALELPNKLIKLCSRSEKTPPLSWLRAELRVKDINDDSGLTASGMFIINPPWKLKEALNESLPLLSDILAQQGHGNHLLESSED